MTNGYRSWSFPVTSAFPPSFMQSWLWSSQQEWASSTQNQGEQQSQEQTDEWSRRQKLYALYLKRNSLTQQNKGVEKELQCLKGCPACRCPRTTHIDQVINECFNRIHRITKTTSKTVTNDKSSSSEIKSTSEQEWLRRVW